MIESLLAGAIEIVERGLVPDALVRAGIRALLAQRLRMEARGGEGETRRRQALLVERLRRGPLALRPERANEQHYELPPEFFVRVLGANLKYSCCYWADGTRTLDDAEQAALDVTCQRADLADGQQVLELGCGWGSLTLWMARRFPKSRILAV